MIINNQHSTWGFRVHLSEQTALVNQTKNTSSHAAKKTTHSLSHIIYPILRDSVTQQSANNSDAFLFDYDVELLLKRCYRHCVRSPQFNRNTSPFPLSHLLPINRQARINLQHDIVNAIAAVIIDVDEKNAFLKKYHVPTNTTSVWTKRKNQGHSFMRFLTSVSAALVTYLSIALLIAQPWGIALGIIGAVTNLGMNLLLLMTNAKSDRTLMALNTGSNWDNVLYGFNAINSLLALAERGIKKSVTSWITLQERHLPIIADIIIAGLLTAEVLYYYGKTLSNFLYKRFRKQETYRKMFVTNLTNHVKQHKTAFKLETTDIKAPNTEQIRFAKRYFEQAEHIMPAIDRLIMQSTKTSPRIHALLRGVEQSSHNETMGLIESLITEQVNLICRQLNDSTDKNNKVLTQLNSLSLHDTIVKHLSQTYPALTQSIQAYQNQKLIDQRYVLAMMKKHYQNAHYPTSPVELKQFFKMVTDAQYHHYQAKEESINHLLIGQPLADINPRDLIYKRPRKIQIHNEIIDLFTSHFVKENTARTRHVKTYLTDFKMALISNKEAKKQERNNVIWSLGSAIIGPMLPAIALLGVVSGPFGTTAAILLYLSTVMINYHFVYKQNRDHLAVKIDEDLAYTHPETARKYAIKTSMVIFLFGDTIANTKIFVDLANEAIKIPKVGLIILGVLFTISTLYRTVIFSFGQINKLFKQPHVAKKAVPKFQQKPQMHLLFKPACSKRKVETSSQVVLAEKMSVQPPVNYSNFTWKHDKTIKNRKSNTHKKTPRLTRGFRLSRQ